MSQIKTISSEENVFCLKSNQSPQRRIIYFFVFVNQDLHHHIHTHIFFKPLLHSGQPLLQRLVWILKLLPIVLSARLFKYKTLCSKFLFCEMDRNEVSLT